MRPVLLTHFDLDGIGCAVIMRMVQPLKDIEFHGHNTIEDAVRGHLEAGTRVICTDIAPKRATLLGYPAEWRSRLSIIDHHAKGPLGEGDVPDLSYQLYDSRYCATELVWEAMLTHDTLDEQTRRDVEMLVKTIRARDLWLRDSAQWGMSEDLQTLMKFVGLRALLDRLTESPSPALTAQEAWVVGMLKAKNNAYIKERSEAFQVVDDPDGYKVAWVHGVRCFSEICHEMLKLCPQADYTVVYDSNTGRVELRSREGGPHVGEIAAGRGGGGHPCASGYSVKVPGFPSG